MSRENNYNAIILKKQPLGEGDELITFYTEELGKVRALAKSVKLAKSKLSPSLQQLFFVRLRLAGGNFPKVIGAEVVNSFAALRESLPAAKAAFYASELALKFSPDEQKNQPLFKLLLQFLNFLNSGHDAKIFTLGLNKFNIDFLEAVGLAVDFDPDMAAAQNLGFSNSRGGFVLGEGLDYVMVKGETFALFLRLKQSEFTELNTFNFDGNSEVLQKLLSGFLNYHLQREIKSEKYLQQ